jgi:O-antigen ligase
VLASLPIVRFTTSAPAWVVVLPLVWLGWQLIAAAQTVDAALTRATVLHFIACVSSFYVGLFALNRMNRSKSFWIMILVGFAWVLWIGFDQHFGGLEATRRWFFEQPNWQEYPSEYLKRIASDRIFSTLVYPNALAGAILLFLPPLLMFTFDLTERVHRIVRGVFVGLLGYAGLACLYWSGSKAGWLIAMVLAVIVLLRLPVERKVKLAVISAALFVGILGFSLKFSNYFQKGATSVGARFDYWRAALVVAKEHPILGTGPGTFSIPYKRIKASDSEMTKLVHNNYLEQASDSGVPGFLAFAWIVFGSIWMLYRKCAGDDLRFAV